eukprot:scaffold118352_cov33-Phaeocystis_antarctica.AAC.1
MEASAQWLRSASSLEGFEAHPPGRGRYLLAGGTKLSSSLGAEGPKLGEAHHHLYLHLRPANQAREHAVLPP